MSESDRALPGASASEIGRTLRRCYAHLGPYRRLVAGASVALTLVNLLSFLIPLLIGTIVDRGIRGQELTT